MPVMSMSGRKAAAARAGNQGWTLVELLVALAIAGVVMGGIVTLLAVQQKTYKKQTATAALMQNMRAAMKLLTDDIRMAGYYTRMDSRVIQGFVNWDPRQPGEDGLVPFLNGIDNIRGISKYVHGADLVVIVRAGSDMGLLQPHEDARLDTNILNLMDLDLDNDGDDDLNASGRPYGVLAKADLTRAQVFKIKKIDPVVTVLENFTASYARGDVIARVDIIVYRVDDKNASFPGPVLERKNAGNGNQFQVVAQGVSDLQIRYVLTDGEAVDSPFGQERRIRGVWILLRGEKKVPGQGGVRREIESFVSIRNAA